MSPGDGSRPKPRVTGYSGQTWEGRAVPSPFFPAWRSAQPRREMTQ